MARMTKADTLRREMKPGSSLLIEEPAARIRITAHGCAAAKAVDELETIHRCDHTWAAMESHQKTCPFGAGCCQ